MAKYWVQIDGACDRPLTEEELFSTYKDHLSGEMPCAKTGENRWGKLIDFFPDWQDQIRKAGSLPVPITIPKEEGVPERYPTLRLISTLYRILAGCVGFLSMVLIVSGIISKDLILTIIGIATALTGIIGCLAIAEVILLFLDIEKNTRKG